MYYDIMYYVCQDHNTFQHRTGFRLINALLWF